MDRDVIVAQKNKERTEAIENEKVKRETELEATERERIVSIAKTAFGTVCCVSYSKVPHELK